VEERRLEITAHTQKGKGAPCPSIISSYSSPLGWRAEVHVSLREAGDTLVKSVVNSTSRSLLSLRAPAA
jgi:hypothetical protein